MPEDKRRLLQVNVSFDFVLKPEADIRNSAQGFWQWLMRHLPENSGVVSKLVTITERFPDGRNVTHAHSTGACLLFLEKTPITRTEESVN